MQFSFTLQPPPTIQKALDALSQKDETIFGEGSLPILRKWRKKQFEVKHDCLMKGQMIYWHPLPDELLERRQT